MDILFSWLGHTDLGNMQDDIDGPISQIACFSDREFQRVFIIANREKGQWEAYKHWLKKRLAKHKKQPAEIEICFAKEVENVVDYGQLALVTKRYLGQLCQADSTVTINLTSGTGAMTAVSTLVGMGKTNCRFVQTDRRKPDSLPLETIIPSDFGDQYISSALAHSASLATAEAPLSDDFKKIATHSPKMKALVSKAQKLALSEVPALILGETGVGKETIAQAIHKTSIRHKHKIAAINCGAIAEGLLESILFGHKKGSFTSANSDQKGIFEDADKGTVFLDEVGELSLNAQTKLLRVLQDQKIRPVGSNKDVSIDVRLIAATHRNLSQMVAEGTFREDLFYRIAVGIVEIPPLRERQEDIEQLSLELASEIDQQMRKHQHFSNYKSKNLSACAIKFMKAQPWPGNIRELWNTLNRAYLWSEGSQVDKDDISNSLVSHIKRDDSNDIFLTANQTVDIGELVDKYKKKYVEAAIKISGGNKSKAAKILGLNSHQVLGKWLKDLSIELD